LYRYLFPSQSFPSLSSAKR
jgi:NADH dehydrogenase 1 beta subcomplex subunit 2